MALQARSEDTRQKEPRCHDDLFSQVGYGRRARRDRLTEHTQPCYRSSIQSRSVKFSNVTNTIGSSRRIVADLLTLARTVQPS
jgi:hypothetical protein